MERKIESLTNELTRWVQRNTFANDRWKSYARAKAFILKYWNPLWSVLELNLVKQSLAKYTLYFDVLNWKKWLWIPSYQNSNKELLSIHNKEKGRLEKDKKKAGIEISKLKEALYEKEKERESLNELGRWVFIVSLSW